MKGYGETVKKYAGILAPFCDPHEFLRLEKLLELAYRFDEEVSTVRTKTFVEKVENTIVSSPDAANITVSTIHGAKGLEYDIVVLPQLVYDITSARHTPELIVDHVDPDNKTTPIDFVLRYPHASIQNILHDRSNKDDRYKKVFERRIQGEVEESLSELYVAMTRAIYQLVMIVPAKSSDSVGKTFEGILRSRLKGQQSAALQGQGILAQGNALGNERSQEPSRPVRARQEGNLALTGRLSDGGNSESQGVALGYYAPPLQGDSCADTITTEGEETKRNVLYDTGDENWFENIERKIEKKVKSETMELTCVLSDKKVSHHVSRIVPSSLHKLVEKAEDDKTHGRGPVWGTAMHACFEHGVEWLDGANEISDAELHKIVADAIKGETFSFKVEDVVTQFRKSCKQPEIVKALSRSRYAAPNVTVERERKFVVWVEEEKTKTMKIMHGSVDRLVVGRDGKGEVTEIEVLDYKSDVAADVKTLVEAYREQLESYRKGMAALYKFDIEKVKATFVFTSLGRVTEIAE
jgi:ATP-dependent exoDNAse (exonuclease V) beta subunit